MRNQLFSILMLFVLSISTIQLTFAEINSQTTILSEERGKDYQQIKYSNGKIIWTAGLSEYVTDAKGNYVNAILTEDANYVYVDSSTPFKVDKATCELVILEKARIVENPQERLRTQWKVQQADLGEETISQNWVDALAPTTSCSVTHWQDSNGVYVQTVQTDGVNKLTTIYEKRANSHLPESHHWFNYDSIDATDRKYGFVSVQKIPNTEKIVIDDKQFSLDINGINKLNIANKTEKEINQSFLTYKDKIFQKTLIFKKISSNDILFDLSKAESLLSHIRVSSENDKLKVETKYFGNNKSLLPNEQLYLDPTFGYASGSQKTWRDPLSSGSCGSGSALYSSGDGYFYSVKRSSDSQYCLITSVRWDISSIPDSATINNTVMRYDVTSGTNFRNCNINPITNDPDTSSASVVYADIQDGTPYVADSVSCASVGNDKTVDLGSTADSSLQSQLTANWFAIGFEPTSMATDSVYHQSVGGTVELQVEYTDSSGSGQTATSSPKEIVAITIPVDDVSLSPNQSMIVLDTTGVGTLELISVTANLPCTSSAPNLKILGGMFGNTTSIINTSADYTGYDGPNFTCIFRDMKNSTAQGITINTILLTNDGVSNVSIPKGVIVTLTGMFK